MGAGNPKVFFKYFFVNTATGEKLGDMLAVAKFAAAEDPEPGTEPGGDENDMVTLTLECSESCIPAPTGAGQFQKGTSVSFSARQKYSEPAEGDMYDVYTFSQWSDGSTERERTMVLNSDTTLTAMYTYSQGYGDE